MVRRRALAMVLGALALAAVGCASPNRQVRVASLETTTTTTPAPHRHPPHPKDATLKIGTAVVLSTAGAALATTGAAMLVCNGGGLGCFGGSPDPSWGRPPSIERTVIPVTGAILFIGGAMALVMVPMWAAIDLVRD